jgi:hypothetical protein
MNKIAVSSISHIITALVVIIIFCFYYSQNNKIPIDWVVYVSPFLLGVLSPDLVDSNKSPNHRSILGHGYFVVYILGLIVIPGAIYLGITQSYLYFHLAVFVAGFLLHLLVDSLSPKGLV